MKKLLLVGFFSFSSFFCRWNEGIAAGQSRPKSAPAFRPRYCFLDKKVLRFFAYFQEVAGLDDRAPEKRIRHVHILYHLEDDSISILEPRTNVIISSFISMYHCISPISILHTKQFSFTEFWTVSRNVAQKTPNSQKGTYSWGQSLLALDRFTYWFHR